VDTGDAGFHRDCSNLVQRNSVSAKSSGAHRKMCAIIF
jgi:hypothetical protein